MVMTLEEYRQAAISLYGQPITVDYLYEYLVVHVLLNLSRTASVMTPNPQPHLLVITPTHTADLTSIPYRQRWIVRLAIRHPLAEHFPDVPSVHFSIPVGAWWFQSPDLNNWVTIQPHSFRLASQLFKRTVLQHLVLVGHAMLYQRPFPVDIKLQYASRQAPGNRVWTAVRVSLAVVCLRLWP